MERTPRAQMLPYRKQNSVLSDDGRHASDSLCAAACNLVNRTLGRVTPTARRENKQANDDGESEHGVRSGLTYTDHRKENMILQPKRLPVVRCSAWLGVMDWTQLVRLLLICILLCVLIGLLHVWAGLNRILADLYEMKC